jgi:hypothetical protein
MDFPKFRQFLANTCSLVGCPDIGTLFGDEGILSHKEKDKPNKGNRPDIRSLTFKLVGILKFDTHIRIFVLDNLKHKI